MKFHFLFIICQFRSGYYRSDFHALERTSVVTQLSPQRTEIV